MARAASAWSVAAIATAQPHLAFRSGDLVAVSVDHVPPHKPLPAEAWSMFQIADVDSGLIRWVNGDLVTHVLPG